MPDWGWLVIGLYAVGMTFIFLYSLVQLSLLVRYRKNRRDSDRSSLPDVLPRVLIQLPVYNELYVVERLIDATAALDYPREKLTIQVLDDSDDESFECARKRVRHWAERGVNIRQVRRPDREGFKAGALEYGLRISDEEFVAVFDADFIPAPGFLQKTIAYFADEKVGMVQTRWGHLNRDYSLLTRVQAFALDAHFTVEQTGRNLGSHFINFNGTAGLWRRSCIESAGGWSADTLTEDLDLSYRAQLKGWHFRFVEDVVSPAELPAEMGALKNQQYRWNKGAAECAVKHLGALLTQKTIPLSTRIHGFFHLLNSSIFIWIVLCAITSLPLLVLKFNYPQYDLLFAIGGVLTFSFIVLALFYYTAFANVEYEKRSRFFWLYPAFLSISMGMSLHNARAVVLGYSGRKTPFIRTPKWNLVGGEGSWKNKLYLTSRIPLFTILEASLCLYFIIALFYAFRYGEWGFIPLHAMLVFGFGSVAWYSLKHAAGR